MTGRTEDNSPTAGGMDIGVIQVTTGDVRHVLVPVENECGGSGVTDHAATEVGKKSGKRERMTDVDDVTEIELRRLDVQETTMAIENGIKT